MLRYGCAKKLARDDRHGVRPLPVHPAAKAETVSPPATEKAKGKFDAPKIPTGPRAFCILLMSGLAAGLRSGSGRSMRAFTHEPSRSNWANNFNCPTVLPRSPINLGSGNPVSSIARFISTSPKASISSAIASKNTAFPEPDLVLYI